VRQPAGRGDNADVHVSLSTDGQVSTLALIAVEQLHRRVPASIVAIDEPEVHLHPGLVARIAIGLQEMSEDIPVLIATQSDACLNAVEQPADNVVLCQLDDQRRMSLQRPDRAQLETWLTEFKGLGVMRGEGLQGVLFPASP
jgi:predicted ATPase